MKWLLLTCFLLWARHGEGGALKCLPGDDECLSQISEEEERQEIDIRRPSGSTDAPYECLPGSEWESNCHRCRCLDGEAQCLRQPGCESIGEPIRCAPNSTFERECNTCVCLESGLGLCTVEPCERIPTEAPVPSKVNIVKGVDCAPGTAWQSQCNDCVCSPDGRRHCTERACPGQDSEPLLRCAPQSQWKNDCNMCWCNSGRAMCTKMGCASISIEMYDEGQTPDSEELPEPNELPEAPEFNSNDLLESDTKDQKHLSENLEDLDTTTDQIEEDLTGVNLKDLDDYDHNDIDTPIQIPDQVMTEFALNIDTKVRNEDEELLEDLLSNDNQETTEEHLQQNSKGNKHVEVSDDSYINNNQIDTKLRNEDEKLLEDLLTNDNQDTTKEHLAENSEGDNKHVEVLGDSYINNNQIDTKLRNEDEKLLEDLLTNDNQDTTKEHLAENSEGDNKHVEVLDDSYINNQRDTRVKRSPCKPNQEFQNECNTCKCSTNGQTYTCTQNECMDRDKEEVDKEVEVFAESEGEDHIQRHSVCKPSEEFFKGCNPCHCNSDGTDFSCTDKPCDPDVEVFHEFSILKSSKNTTKKVCVENRMFINDCNTCWCNEDGSSYFCTRKVCQDPELNVEAPEGLKSSKNTTKKVCVENRMFIMDCNTCWCNEDGTSYFCTRKVCQDSEPNVEGTENQTVSRKTRSTQQEAPKACQPGQEFRLDCNKCLCDNLGQNFSCTRIDCAALNNNNNGARRKRDVSQKVSADCVPGSVFDQGCNVCRCTVDGGHATCTLKRCPTKENSTLTATESSFRCNPGEQFKQSCNDCSCSADGRSVFCTLRVCDEDLAP